MIAYLSLERWGEAETDQINTEVGRHDRSGFHGSRKPSVRLARGREQTLGHLCLLMTIFWTRQSNHTTGGKENTQCPKKQREASSFHSPSPTPTPALSYTAMFKTEKSGCRCPNLQPGAPAKGQTTSRGTAKARTSDVSDSTKEKQVRALENKTLTLLFFQKNEICHGRVGCIGETPNKPAPELG